MALEMGLLSTLVENQDKKTSAQELSSKTGFNEKLICMLFLTKQELSHLITKLNNVLLSEGHEDDHGAWIRQRNRLLSIQS